MEAYSMEELLPVVAELTERYTSGESTSVTYERAQYLMEAVLYCIHECSTPLALSGGRKLSAREAYSFGLETIKEKVVRTRQQYQKLMEDFCAYGNRNYEDTVTKAIPGFFARYDVYFAPQETLITMDYPVLKRLEGMQGIDAMEAYVSCVFLEQRFLRAFGTEDVVEILTGFQPNYRQQFYNICRIVLRKVVAERLLERLGRQMEELLHQGEKERLMEEVNKTIESIVREDYGADTSLFTYLKEDTDDFVTELIFYWQKVKKKVR